VIQSPNVVHTTTGTYVKVKLKEENDIEKLTPSFVKEVLHKFYNAVLLGYYGEKRVTINDEILDPWKPDPANIEREKEINIQKVKRYKINIKGFLIKTKEKLPESFQGPSIVVYGKTVKQEWFRQYPTCGEYIIGLIIADGLIDILRTSKSDFDTTSFMWKRFSAVVGKFIGDWLDEIGAKAKPPEISEDTQGMTKTVEEKVNEILKLPEFKDLAGKFFQNIIQKQISIKRQRDELKGKSVEGGQKVGGTLGGLGGGEGVITKGDEEEKGVEEDEKGADPIERVRRKMRGGIKISFAEEPANVLEGWIDLSTPAVIINVEHPAYKIAGKLGTTSKKYHFFRTVFAALAEETDQENSKKIMADLFSKLPIVL